jgi:hypothetical protein
MASKYEPYRVLETTNTLYVQFIEPSGKHYILRKRKITENVGGTDYQRDQFDYFHPVDESQTLDVVWFGKETLEYGLIGKWY